MKTRKGFIAGSALHKQYGSSPMKKGKSDDILDKVQTGLTAAGLTPGVGVIPDLINVGVSGARTVGAKLTGNIEILFSSSSFSGLVLINNSSNLSRKGKL